jgi:SAM-dependent methyltransferase
VLIAVGLVGIWIPFTLHLLGVLVVVGAMMVLRNSATWRRRFVRLHRRHPKHVHRLRRLLRKKPEIWPVIWHEMLRSERFFLPRKWQRLRRWRRAVFDRFKPRARHSDPPAPQWPEAPAFDAAYFEGLYRAHPDPWRFETSRYENRKYDATVAALDRRRYRRVLEIGCSIGVLTRRLASRAEAVVALDISDSAIATARTRAADLPHVQFLAADFLRADLTAAFDMIVFSEVLYYLTPADLTLAARRTADLLEPGGEVMLVHWLGEGDHTLTGDQAADGFMAALGPGFRRLRHRRKRRYRLDDLRHER